MDDEPDIREVVNISLGLDPGFEVKACASGAEALAIAAEWPPSFILLDIVMPIMDGPTTFINLRRNPQTAHIPVLFTTARSHSKDMEYLVMLGARGVLSKPFDPMKLAGLVRRLCA